MDIRKGLTSEVKCNAKYGFGATIIGVFAGFSIWSKLIYTERKMAKYWVLALGILGGIGCGASLNSPRQPACTYTLSPFGGGSGTQADPYTICTVAHLMQVQNYLSSSFKLYNDLDLMGSNFTPIGSKTNNQPFSGTFDGNGRRISNFIYNNLAASDTVGFFSFLTGTVKNLNVSGSISTNKNAGFIAGATGLTGIIQNCTSSGTLSNSSGIANSMGGLLGSAGMGLATGSTAISYSSSTANLNSSSNGNFGGLVGVSSGPLSITQSYFSGSFSACNNASCGGLVGASARPLTIRQSYFSLGTITAGAASYVGGLVAVTLNTANIQNSFSTGNISSSGYVAAGIVGTILSASSLSLTNVFAANSIQGTPSLKGGLVGQVYGTTISVSSYWDSQLGPTTTADTGSSPAATAAMQNRSTYDGWDFSTIWNPPSPGTYPTLR